MFNNTLNYYIDYLLLLKDEQINLNYLLIYDVFIKYYNNLINKNYLLDEHSRRNALFIQWYELYKYKNNIII
jgi:hypothetical protein